jgi:hypothetical protein
MANVGPNLNVIAPAGGAPLEGIDYLLNVVGFHDDPAERVQLTEAGLANYEDFGYLVKKMSGTWRRNSLSVRR